jgi:mono/diheme cytochrome c family protein
MRKRRLQLGLALFISGLAFLYSYTGSSSRAQRANTPAQRALIEENCVVCHNQKSKTAGVSLQGLNFDNVGENAALWERVLRKVRTGQMPPPGAPRPEASEVAAFVKWLEGALDRAARLDPNPGRPRPPVESDRIQQRDS